MTVETDETLEPYVLGSGDFRDRVWLRYDAVDLLPAVRELTESKKVRRIELIYDFDINFDIEALRDNLQKLSDYFLETLRAGLPFPHIPVLTGFLLREKFMGWGWDRFYRAPDGNLYAHPRFFTSAHPEQGRLDSEKSHSKIVQIMRPHLVCQLCKCFFCYQDPIHNKKTTAEYKIPSRLTCRITSIFNEFSVNLANELLGANLKAEDLDKLDSREFEAQRYFDAWRTHENEFMNLKCLTSGEDAWNI